MEKKKKTVLLEGDGREVEKVVQKGSKCGRGRLKVAYTNINGLMAAVLELEDYLKEEKPDIMGTVETKLASVGDILNIGEGKFILWMRNRKNKRGGAMLLVRKDLLVESVTYGLEEAEVLRISLRQNMGRYRNVVVI